MLVPTFVENLLSKTNLIYGTDQQNQWQQKLFHIFSKRYDWNKDVSSCGDFDLLGGYKLLSRDSLSNKFELPGHTHVRIGFTVSLIDHWQGELVYLQVNMGARDMASENVNFCEDWP